jgi:hypothetical protein
MRRKARGFAPRFFVASSPRHCEERSDEAIHLSPGGKAGLLRCDRNDGGNKRMSHLDLPCDMSFRMVLDRTSTAQRIVIDDRSRLPGRFFGRFATSATSELTRAA